MQILFFIEMLSPLKIEKNIPFDDGAVYGILFHIYYIRRILLFLLIFEFK